MYLDANNLYGWAMCKMLPIGSFRWATNLSKYTEYYIKNYNENSDTGYFLEVDIEYPKTLWGLYKDLPFLPEKKKLENVEKLVTSIEDKEKYVIHISALKQALNHELKLKEVHRVIEFKQEAWLKPYIDMNTRLRTEAKDDFAKDFFKLMNNSVFGKTMENVRNHSDIKLVTANERRKKLVSEPNYYTTKYFSENLLAIEKKKKRVVLNKPIYLGQTILDVSKTLMYDFGMIILSQSITTKQNYAIWILIVLLFMLKLKIFSKILQRTLINGLTHLHTIKMIIDHCP